MLNSSKCSTLNNARRWEVSIRVHMQDCELEAMWEFWNFHTTIFV